MRRMLGLAVSGFLCLGAGSATASDSSSPGESEPLVRVEHFGVSGTGAHIRVPTRTPGPMTTRTSERAAQGDGEVEPISFTGLKGTRLDVTILGDGYAADEQGELSTDARAAWSAVSAVEPYRSYTGVMNVRLVHSVSAESGVSGDPTADVVRNTALGTRYWCSGIERLICVDLARVRTYAALSPASDMVLVVVNSATYGGGGYSDLDDSGYPFAGVATFAGKNSISAWIAVHEVGHSLGSLADEYDYGDGATWTGGEIPRPNVTNQTESQMLATRSKWFRWVGTTDPSGGLVGSYEGAYYRTYGAFRPSSDSLMRSLGATDFNAPSREWLIDGIYRYADVIVARTPTTQVQPRTTVLRVGKASLGAGLARVQIRWAVDEVEKKGVRNRLSVRPSALGVPRDGRIHTVSATALDLSAALREPSIKQQTRNTVTWQVR